MTTPDVRIRGSGAVAKALALALGALGLRVALDRAADIAAGRADVRALALNRTSVDLLRSVRVWSALPPGAVTPVHDMRVQGDAAGAALHLSSWRLRLPELASIVDAPALDRALDQAVAFSPQVTLVAASTDAASAALEAICEGGASATRERLGVAWDRAPSGQQAIAARLVATRPHANVARQWFRSPDVLALLPFDAVAAGSGLALVWSLPDAAADAMMTLPEADFVSALEAATDGGIDGTTGSLRLVSERSTWPLASALATPWCGPGWVLLGDAAHQVHPLAGQGLNLGLADVAALAAVVAEREPWRSLGDERLLRRYARERVPAAVAMRRVTDGLLRLFADEAPALRELRNRGLTLADLWPSAKRRLAERALRS